MNKPPFELNNSILNLVANITKRIGYIEGQLDKKQSLHLRKVSKIKSINSSTAIEGNTLTEDEVISILQGKMVVAPRNEIQEVKNAYNAYDNISKFKEYDVNSFLEAHKLLTADLIKESGKFRNGNIGIYDGLRCVHMGAKPEYVPNLIKGLFKWAKDTDVHPLVKACIMHFEIEFIHPFADGNGRIGRLWQSLILYNYNNIFEYLPIETLVYKHQQEYYKALSVSSNLANSTHFIEFMLDMILQTIENFNLQSKYKNLIDKFKLELSSNDKKILTKLFEYFEKEETINIEIANELLGKNSANIRRYFRKFIELEILIPEGENKARIYKINKKIFEN